MNLKKLTLAALLGLISAAGFAQKKINEGIITYQVEWMPPPGMQQNVSRLPTELVVYFKGDSAATDSKSPLFSNRVITNTKTEYIRLLMDIPMMSKKYSVIFTPDDIEQMQEMSPEFSATASSESKSVAGYNAVKHTIKEKKSGQSFDAWFTKEISLAPNSLTAFYNSELGIPLIFHTVAIGMPLKASVKEIKEVSVPAGSFTGTKEHEEITLAQLMGIIGGRR